MFFLVIFSQSCAQISLIPRCRIYVESPFSRATRPWFSSWAGHQVHLSLPSLLAGGGLEAQNRPGRRYPNPSITPSYIAAASDPTPSDCQQQKCSSVQPLPKLSPTSLATATAATTAISSQTPPPTSARNPHSFTDKSHSHSTLSGFTLVSSPSLNLWYPIPTNTINFYAQFTLCFHFSARV